MSLGEQIKKYRAALGLKLDQLSELCEVAPGTISALTVRGSSRSEHALAIARKGFGLSLEQLLDENNDYLSTAFSHVSARPPRGWVATHELLGRVADSAPLCIESSPARPASAPTPIGRKEFQWPFKLVTYTRIERVRQHFSGHGMPNAISDIDKHLDVLVARWENEIKHTKSSGR